MSSSLVGAASGSYHPRRASLVQVLGERLGEPVGERLDHDRAVVVVLGLVTGGELVGAVDRDGEGAEVVACGRDVVGQAAVRPRVALGGLLAQHREAHAALEHDVVALGAAPARSRRRRGLQEAVAHDLVEQRRRVVVELARRRLLEDRRELALQLPGVEEELPVDVGAQLRERRLDGARAGERGLGEVVEGERLAVRPRGRRAAAAAGAPSRRAARAAAPAPRGSRRRARRGGPGRAGPRRRRRRGRRRARAPSRWPYAGAIRTAVCWREVVAPPISSGSSSPRRSISFATCTISSSDGVIRPERPTTSAPSATAVSRIVSAGTITPRSITS